MKKLFNNLKLTKFQLWELYHNKSNRKYFTIPLIGWVIIICVIIVSRLIHEEISRNYDFSGVVENVTYDRNLFPVVTIKGQAYDLNYERWNTKRNQIQIGDSMIKKKGELELKLIKDHSRDTIYLLHKEPQSHH